jgi:hypothetical protein
MFLDAFRAFTSFSGIGSPVVSSTANVFSTR